MTWEDDPGRIKTEPVVREEAPMAPGKKVTAAWLLVYTLILVVMLGTAFALRTIAEKPAFRTIATPTARTTLIPPETTTPRPP